MSDHIPIDLQDEIYATLGYLFRRLEKASHRLTHMHQSVLISDKNTANAAQNYYSPLFNCVFSFQGSGLMQVTLCGDNFTFGQCLGMYEEENRQAIKQNYYSALFNCIFSIQESGEMQIVLRGNHFIVKWGVSGIHDGEPEQSIIFMPDPSFYIDPEIDTGVEE